MVACQVIFGDIHSPCCLPADAYGDGMKMELLQLATLLIRRAPNQLVQHRKELIKFGWNHLKRDDSAAKYYAFLNVCHFLDAYQAPEKIVLQVTLPPCQPLAACPLNSFRRCCCRRSVRIMQARPGVSPKFRLGSSPALLHTPAQRLAGIGHTTCSPGNSHQSEQQRLRALQSAHASMGSCTLAAASLDPASPPDPPLYNCYRAGVCGAAAHVARQTRAAPPNPDPQPYPSASRCSWRCCARARRTPGAP